MSNATEPLPLSGKITVPLAASYERALLLAASTTHRELSDIVLRALVEWLIANGFLKGAEADLSRLTFAVVDEAVAAAQSICRAGGFDEAITLRAIQACCKNPEWLRNYGAIVGPDNIWKTGVQAKGNINREIGFRIRAGIGGVTVKLADGKTNATKRVTGEIIQSYTPMASYDDVTFGPAKAA
jgi:hypothetical protein